VSKLRAASVYSEVKMKVLVCGEYSQTVTKAFRDLGHEAYSNDLLKTEGNPAWHLQGDMREIIWRVYWDLILLHVPCTAMAVCGNRHYANTDERKDAIIWTLQVWQQAKLNARSVALENPASVIFPHLRKRGADIQYIQPWEFGHPEQKKTGFALHNLPRLVGTHDVYKEMMALPVAKRERIFRMAPSADRGKERARFYSGIAEAMADQWGYFLESTK
jgi:hypothetical protein